MLEANAQIPRRTVNIKELEEKQHRKIFQATSLLNSPMCDSMPKTEQKLQRTPSLRLKTLTHSRKVHTGQFLC